MTKMNVVVKENTRVRLHLINYDERQTTDQYTEKAPMVL
jgi:hypothetical protein